MGEIKKAILGTTSERVRGDIKFAGYVPDMGDLPELIDGQPRGLWTRDIDGDGTDDITKRYMYMPCKENTSTIFLGWRGPYLKPPKGVLKDAWGNPFIFKRKDNDFVIRSRSADGKQGGTGYGEDIELIIKENDWLGSVAGYISPYVVDLSMDDPISAYIYYVPKTTPDGEEKAICVPIDKDDRYFYFDNIPIGTNRFLAIVQNNVMQPYKIYIEPGINWLGNMGSVP